MKFGKSVFTDQEKSGFHVGVLLQLVLIKFAVFGSAAELSSAALLPRRTNVDPCRGRFPDCHYVCTFVFENNDIGFFKKEAKGSRHDAFK